MRPGGRPRQIEMDDIVAAGRQIGLTELSLASVASGLGVSPTALYRHVENRWGLETAVGESLLADLELRDDPAHGIEAHLLSFGLQLYRFVVTHPGLAGYLQTVFPRGESGRRLLSEETAAIERRGYSTEAAIVLSGAVASQAIGHAAAADAQRRSGRSVEQHRRSALGELAADPRLDAAHTRLPQLSMAENARLMLTASVAGIVAAIPAGDVTAALTALDEKSKGL